MTIKTEETKIFVITKSYFGGRIEFVSACYNEELARSLASQQLPKITETFTIGVTEVRLIGSKDEYK